MPYRHIRQSDREMIDRMRFSGASLRRISAETGFNVSTISRELSRNSQADGQYLASAAEAQARDRRRQSKAAMVRWYNHPKLYQYVTSKLQQDWSPEQICGRLLIDHPNDAAMRVSHESIYAWIRMQAALGHYWTQHLRFGGRRRKRYGSQDLRGQIRNRTPISERPAEANERSECGHWECDTMEGSGKSGHLVTMTDRRSRLAALRVATNKSATVVRKAIIRGLKRHEGHPVRTITTDNGKEFAEHEQLGITLKAKTFFAKPYRSWERGSNENMNGLIRQYFPKGTDFKTITPAALACVERKLNNRPRKCLGFKTPMEVYYSPNKT